MKNNRRTFLKIASLSAATTIVPKGFSLTAHHPPAAIADGTSLIGLSAASFRPWIGSRFGFVDYTGAYLILLAVDESVKPDALPGAPKLVGRTRLRTDPNFTISFALRFQTIGMATQMKQTSYLLTHNGLGRFPLFLVPAVGRAAQICTAQFSAPPTAPIGIGRPVPVRPVHGSVIGQE
jgi:hypothetical protein